MKRDASQVKLLAIYDFKKGKVTLFNIGINTAGNRTIDLVDNIENGLNLWDTTCEKKVLLHNQCIDTGGGDT